jgi:hypothetical protein
MMTIGCDFHPSWQQVSWLDTETGDTGEWKLIQAPGRCRAVLSAISDAVADWHGGDRELSLAGELAGRLGCRFSCRLLEQLGIDRRIEIWCSVLRCA